MTVYDLKGLMRANEKLVDDRMRLEELENAVEGKIARIDGLPPNRNYKDDQDILALIADLRTSIAAQDVALSAIYRAINAMIDTIDDPHISRICKARYLDCRSWSMVAYSIGGGNGKDTVRMAHDRYMRKHGAYTR